MLVQVMRRCLLSLWNRERWLECVAAMKNGFARARLDAPMSDADGDPQLSKLAELMEERLFTLFAFSLGYVPGKPLQRHSAVTASNQLRDHYYYYYYYCYNYYYHYYYYYYY